jgi:hypothetical protein
MVLDPLTSLLCPIRSCLQVLGGSTIPGNSNGTCGDGLYFHKLRVDSISNPRLRKVKQPGVRKASAGRVAVAAGGR